MICAPPQAETGLETKTNAPPPPNCPPYVAEDDESDCTLWRRALEEILTTTDYARIQGIARKALHLD